MQSLPLWERGLKYGIRLYRLICYASLPLWERGLKSARLCWEHWKQLSLPLWERGLKYLSINYIGKGWNVAPLVGAWIEIARSADSLTAVIVVAPLVGAWIEIRYATDRNYDRDVAPLVGAWIEIFAC